MSCQSSSAASLGSLAPMVSTIADLKRSSSFASSLTFYDVTKASERPIWASRFRI